MKRLPRVVNKEFTNVRSEAQAWSSGRFGKESSLHPLRDYVHDDRSPLVHHNTCGPVKDAAQGRGNFDRAEALNVKRLSDRREVGVRVFDVDADAAVLDRPATNAGHVILVAFIVAVGAVVVDDEQ